jgi:hypothetical protein
MSTHHLEISLLAVDRVQLLCPNNNLWWKSKRAVWRKWRLLFIFTCGCSLLMLAVCTPFVSLTRHFLWIRFNVPSTGPVPVHVDRKDGLQGVEKENVMFFESRLVVSWQARRLWIVKPLYFQVAVYKRERKVFILCLQSPRCSLSCRYWYSSVNHVIQMLLVWWSVCRCQLQGNIWW